MRTETTGTARLGDAPYELRPDGRVAWRSTAHAAVKRFYDRALAPAPAPSWADRVSRAASPNEVDLLLAEFRGTASEASRRTRDQVERHAIGRKRELYLVAVRRAPSAFSLETTLRDLLLFWPSCPLAVGLEVGRAAYARNCELEGVLP
jgi:hypothetical protein